VDILESPPVHDVVAGRNMVSFKSTATNVTAADYLEGTKYVIGIYGLKNGVRFLIPGPPCDDPMETDLDYGWHSRNQGQSIHKCGSVDHGGADNDKSINRTKHR
jgi:hypothetical protein